MSQKVMGLVEAVTDILRCLDAADELNDLVGLQRYKQVDEYPKARTMFCVIISLGQSCDGLSECRI